MSTFIQTQKLSKVQPQLTPVSNRRKRKRNVPILNDDILKLIFETYLSDYTWIKLMSRVIANDNDCLTDFIDIINLKYVCKLTYAEFTRWDDSNWRIDNTSLFKYYLGDIQQYLNDMWYRYSQGDDETVIVWQDDPREHDYEFWYDINYKFIGENMKIGYIGYIYTVPFRTCCVTGSASVTEGLIMNESVDVLSKRSGFLPSVKDIMAALRIPGYWNSKIHEVYPGLNADFFRYPFDDVPV